MKTTIVIPTYWGRAEGALRNPVDIVYDHPTPLNQSGTLARCLNSFTALDRADFEVVIIAAPTHPELETETANKVQEIIRPYRTRLNLNLVTPARVAALRGAMGRELGRETAALINCYGYSNIRNLCLISGHAGNAANIILIDDDEIIEYPEFLDRALDRMEGGEGSPDIKAKAGWYMRPDGGYMGPPTGDPWWEAWQGAEAMNAGFETVIGGDERFSSTPFAFGGNMVVSREVFTDIAFDPKIPRGEDLDFVFNAMLGGFEFIMDKELWIKHKPPVSGVPDWMGFRINALRFIYARQKLLTQPAAGIAQTVKVEDLDPYPGRFLRGDLDDKIKRTCLLLGQRYVNEGDTAAYGSAMQTPELAQQLRQNEQQACADYLILRRRWQNLMKHLPHNPAAAELRA